MIDGELHDLLEHIRSAASDARIYVEGMSKDEFVQDKRTQHAVTMCLLIVGEAATKILSNYPDFAAKHAATPWRNMKGMRNRIAHGYFEINLETVWSTVESALPALLATLPKT